MESILQQNQINFIDLDVVCMETVFKFLSLRDLAAMSLTCKIYKAEAERFFKMHRESHCKPINIKSTNEDVDFEFKAGAEYAYERVFEKMIRSVDCNFYGSFTNDDTEFIKEYCADQLRSLTLNFVNGRGDEIIDGSPIEVMRDQLKDIKDLKVTNFIVRDLHNEILRYCEKLECLTIEVDRGGHDEYYGVYADNWLMQTYPQLTTLKLCMPKYMCVHIDSFLALNPNVNHFVCSNIWSIFDVCQSEAEFQSVAFIFFHEHDFTWLMDAMREWTKKKLFHELELVISIYEFQSDVMSGLATTFENITSLHLGHNIDFFIYCDLNVSLPSVKMLCVDFEAYEGSPPPSTRVVYAQLNKFFPNLCKLQMQTGKDVDNGILDAVHRLKELKNFELVNEQCDMCMLTKYTDLNR